MHEPAVDELIDEFIAQPFDIHGVAAGVVAQSLAKLRGAGRVRTADVHATFVLREFRIAFRTLFREDERRQRLFAEVFFHADDVRDDLARLFDDDDVPLAHVLALDLVGVVQAGPLDDRTGQLDRFKIGHGRDRAGLAHLDTDRREPRGSFVFLEFVGDRPAGGLRSRPEPLALVVAVHLEHQAVDLEVQLVQP